MQDRLSIAAREQRTILDEIGMDPDLIAGLELTHHEIQTLSLHWLPVAVEDEKEDSGTYFLPTFGPGRIRRRFKIRNRERFSESVGAGVLSRLKRFSDRAKEWRAW